ncbi:hypothetical protein Dimus_003748 [Dionaea muscipula]
MFLVGFGLQSTVSPPRHRFTPSFHARRCCFSSGLPIFAPAVVPRPSLLAARLKLGFAAAQCEISFAGRTRHVAHVALLPVAGNGRRSLALLRHRCSPGSMKKKQTRGEEGDGLFLGFYQLNKLFY